MDTDGDGPVDIDIVFVCDRVTEGTLLIVPRSNHFSKSMVLEMCMTSKTAKVLMTALHSGSHSGDILGACRKFSCALVFLKYSFDSSVYVRCEVYGLAYISNARCPVGI